MSMQGINNASNNRIHELGGIKLSKLCNRTRIIFAIRRIRNPLNQNMVEMRTLFAPKR